MRTEETPLLDLYDHNVHKPNWLSFLTFSWVSRFLSDTNAKLYVLQDSVNELSRDDEAATVNLKRDLSGKEGVAGTLFVTFGWRWLKGAPLKLLYDCLHFLGPVALKEVIAYLEKDSSNGKMRATIWAGAFMLAMFLRSVLMQHFIMMMSRLGIHVRVTLLKALYAKLLKLPMYGRSERTFGQLINLVSSDCENIGPLLIPESHLLWSGPLQIIVGVLMLYHLLGNAALVGMSFALILFPVSLYLGNKYQTSSDVLMRKRDNRLYSLENLLKCIRQVKFSALENSYHDKVTKRRRLELNELRKLSFIDAYLWFLWQFSPIAIAACAFIYMAIDPSSPPLTPSRAFAALSLFNILNFPMSVLPEIIASVISARISCRRLTRFMRMTEVDGRVQDTSRGEGIVGYLPLRRPLRDDHSNSVNYAGVLPIPKGKLTIITGPVGCGKSTLLYKLLGEGDSEGAKERNSMPAVLNGDQIAFASQDPYLLNASIRDNIVFGALKHYDASRYRKVLRLCELTQDLRNLKHGDRTLAGEGGAALSGGQKARIALARALYSDAETYVLDDVLSNVDASVEWQISDKVFGPNGVLRNQTRILCTHGGQLLPSADLIICVRQGRIVDYGKYQELRHRGMQMLLEKADNSTSSPKRPHSHIKAAARESPPSLPSYRCCEASEAKNFISSPSLLKEDRAVGQVSLGVYYSYFRYMGGYVGLLVLMGIIAQASTIAVDQWLSFWSNSHTAPSSGLSSKHFAFVYVMISVLALVSVLLRQFFSIMASMNASRKIHGKMLAGVLRCPVGWFDQNPVGRILNRFSKDVEAVDVAIPSDMMLTLVCLVATFGAIVLVLYHIPAMLLVMVPILYVYSKVGRKFTRTSRELKRLESISKSQVVSLFAESARGLDVIRAYGNQKVLQKDLDVRIDKNTAPSLMSVAAGRWMSLRLEMLSLIFVGAIGWTLISARSLLSAGNAGLVLSYSVKLSAELYWLVLMLSITEAGMPSVERCVHYIERLPKEGLREEKRVDAMLTKRRWPERGSITFRRVFMRYRPDLPLAVKGVTLDIKGGTTLGVCGRTGCGKSSLVKLLFRLVEPEDGTVLIDGIDYRRIGLHLLRSKMDIIAQDTSLMGSTIREVVDPSNIKSDAEIWNALERCLVKSRIASLPDGLDSRLSEGATNFSPGEKQLLGMTRVLLRQSQILVCDESSSAVDEKTEDQIQEVMQKAFEHSTVIFIAHRIRAILKCDLVIVMDNGQIIEGPQTPAALLQEKTSRLRRLMNDSYGTKN